MKINDVKIPVLPVRNGFTPKELDANGFKGSGVGMTQFGVAVGDVIEMPETEADLKGYAIPIRKGDPDSPQQRVFLALKNGAPAWVGMTVLTRRDYKMQPTDPVTTFCKDAQSDYDRLKLVLGKTIKCTSTVDVEETVFEAGQPTDKTVVKPRPYCEFVE